MNKIKKPSIVVYALTTVGAVLSLLSAMILIAKDTPEIDLGLVLFLQLLTTLLLVIASVGGWHRYSKLYVEYEVEKRLQEQESTD
ncbi:MAG: hypothetical protein ACYSUK_03885 [Planctomycetota bacterium]|jgi:hypothetical protein